MTLSKFHIAPLHGGVAEVTERKAARIEVFSPLRENAYPPAGYTAAPVTLSRAS